LLLTAIFCFLCASISDTRSGQHQSFILAHNLLDTLSWNCYTRACTFTWYLGCGNLETFFFKNNMSRSSSIDDDFIVGKTRESNLQHKHQKEGDRKLRRYWVYAVTILTCFLPRFLLNFCMKNPQIQMAFREKLVLNFIIFLISAFFFFIIIGLGLIVCPARNTLSSYEVDMLKDHNIVSMYGNWYKINDVYESHVVKAGHLSSGAFKDTVLGKDVSPMFDKVSHFSSYCPGLQEPPNGWDNIKREM
jgi:hypothetical protein